jgi:hypothetical protein
MYSNIVFSLKEYPGTIQAKKDATEQHINSFNFSIVVMTGKYDEPSMQENADNFVKWIDDLPKVGAHVVILHNDDNLCNTIFKRMAYTTENVPVAVFHVNDMNIVKQADGKKIELIPSLSLLNTFSKKDFLESFEGAYNLLDFEDKKFLLDSIPQEEIVDEGDDSDSDEEDDDSDEEDDDSDEGDDGITNEILEQLDEFIEGDEEVSDVSSSEYGSDDMSTDEDEWDTSDGDDLDRLKDEKKECEKERSTLIEKYAIRHKLKLSTEEILDRMAKKSPEKFHDVEEFDETLRKIKNDIAKFKASPADVIEILDESEEDIEDDSIASRLKRRRGNKANNNWGIDPLTATMANFHINKGEKFEDEESEDLEPEEEDLESDEGSDME